MSNIVPKSIPIFEAGIRVFFDECESIEEVGALWAALDSITTDSARKATIALGGDPDTLKASVEKYFLQNPLD